MLVYQKTIDRYYCIKSFCHLKTWENASIFLLPIMVGKSMKVS